MSFPPSVTGASGVASLESRVAALREEVFALADEARRVAPFGQTALHVSLQAASNELGKVEQALRGER